MFSHATVPARKGKDTWQACAVGYDNDGPLTIRLAVKTMARKIAG